MSSLFARAAHRGALALWSSHRLGQAAANPLCSATSEANWGLGGRFSSATLLDASALAAPTAGPSVRQQEDPAAIAHNPLHQPPPTAAVATASATKLPGPRPEPALAGASAPAAATATAAAAPDMQQPSSLLEQMQQAQAEGRHVHAVDLFVKRPALWEHLSMSEQRALSVSALRACAAAGDARRAQLVASQMWRRPGLFVGPVVHLWVLQACTRGGQLKEGFRYLQSISSRRLQPRMCEEVLLAAVSRGDEQGIQWAKRVEGLMARRGIAPRPRSYAALIELRGLEGKVEGVESTWQQAVEQYGEEYHAMLHAARATGLARAHALGAAVDALEHQMDSLTHLLPLDSPSPSPLVSLHRRHQQQGQQQPQQQQAGSGVAAADLGAARVSAGAAGATQHGMDGREAAGLIELDSGSRAAPAPLPPLEYLRGACNAVLSQAQALEDLTVVKRLTHLMTQRGLPPNTTTYNLLLRAAARRAVDPTAAVQAVEDGMREMEALRVPPNLLTFELLIRARGSAGDVAGVGEALHEAAAAGLQPSEATWESVMRALGAAGDLEGVGRAFDQLAQSVSRLREGAFRAAFEAARGWGANEAALRAESDAPSATLANQRAYHKQLAGALLQKWVALMEELGVHHSPASFVALIHALGYAGRSDVVVQAMNRAFGQAVQSGTNGNSNSSGSGGSGSKGGAAGVAGSRLERRATQQALQAAQQAQQQGEGSAWQFQRSVVPGKLQPDARLFSAAIGACCRVARLDDAVAMLRLLRASGLEASAHHYTSLIACCAYVRMPSLARTLFADMKERGVAPSLHTYNALLKVECHCGSLDAAVQLVQDMQLQGRSPDAVSWRTLLSAAKFLGRSDVADMARRQLSGASKEGAEEGEGEGQQVGQGPGEEGWRNYYEAEEEEGEEDEW